MIKVLPFRLITPQYAAGFFDGEGCVNITISGANRQAVLRVMIVNTDTFILQAFQCLFGGSLNTPRTNKQGWKAFNCLTLRGQVAAQFLRVIQPHVILKASQINLALEFWDFMQMPLLERCERVAQPTDAAPYRTNYRRTAEVKAKELEFKERMHVLNRKGA